MNLDCHARGITIYDKKEGNKGAWVFLFSFPDLDDFTMSWAGVDDRLIGTC